MNRDYWWLYHWVCISPWWPVCLLLLYTFPCFYCEWAKWGRLFHNLALVTDELHHGVVTCRCPALWNLKRFWDLPISYSSLYILSNWVTDLPWLSRFNCSYARTQPKFAREAIRKQNKIPFLCNFFFFQFRKDWAPKMGFCFLFAFVMTSLLSLYAVGNKEHLVTDPGF